MEQKYVSGEAAARKSGISLHTLRRLADNNQIDVIKTPGGIRRYNIEKYIADNTNVAAEEKPKHQICYCRVSSYGQVDDLDRQVEYMKDKYPDFEIITDVGSGINFERKGLQKIIDIAIAGQLEKLAVSYKDRLCRIGYPLIEHLLIKYSNTEIIVDAEKAETVNEEIANDLMQIITVYTAKINGMRSYKKPTL
jgi:predicted site-specific integrase-resolvase